MPLVLSRKEDETIVVDGPAVIRVQRIHLKRVEIAVEAPPSTSIVRGELSEENPRKPELGESGA